MRLVHAPLPLFALVAACYHGVEESPFPSIDDPAPLDASSSGGADVPDDDDGSSGGGSSSGDTTETTGEPAVPEDSDRLSACELCGCHVWSAVIDPTAEGLPQDLVDEPTGVTLTPLRDGGVLLASAASSALTLHRFDADGQPLWSRSFPGQVAGVRALPIGDDFMIVAGTLTGALELSASLPSGTLQSHGGADGFAALLSEAGEGAMVWAANFGDGADQVVSDLAVTGCEAGLVDGCRLHLAGVHTGDLGLGPAEPGGAVYHAQLPAVYWEPTQATVWRAASEVTSEVGTPSLAAAPDGSVTLAATVRDASDQGDIVVRRIGPDEQEQYNHRFASPGQQRATAAAQAGDYLWIAGDVHARTDLGAGAFGTDGQQTAFLAALAADGAAVVSRTVGGSLAARQAITNLQTKAVVVTGYTNGDVDLGGGTLGFRGGRDVILARYDADGEYLCGALYGDVALQEGLAAASFADRTFVLARVEGSIDFGHSWHANESRSLVLAAFRH